MELAMQALTLLIAAAGLAACAGSAGADGKITISKAVWADFQTYRANVLSVGHGYYAVTEDGQGGASWGCKESRCAPGPSARSEAIKQCEKVSSGHTCLVFAENRDIVVPYEIAQ